MDRTDMTSAPKESDELPAPVRYLPFLSGRYTVSPGLSQLSAGPVFLLDREYVRATALKAELLAGNFVKHVRFTDFPAELESAIAIRMATLLAEESPRRFAFNGKVLRSGDVQIPVDSGGAFDAICRLIQEDAVVIRIVGSRDFNAAIHLCFANGWSPEEKIGKSFFETHAPVPGIAAINARAHDWARMMVNSTTPLVRFVWGMRFDDWLDHHPQSPSLPFDRDQPRIFIRVERQTILGLPERQASLFLIRTFLYDSTALGAEERHALADAIDGMNEESAAYKGVAEHRSQIVRFLRAVPTQGG